MSRLVIALMLLLVVSTPGPFQAFLPLMMGEAEPMPEIMFTQVPQDGTDDGEIDTDSEWYWHNIWSGIMGNIFKSFIRFPDVEVPKGAQILTAKITFKCADSESGNTVRVNIAAEDAHNPAYPADYDEVNTRPRTSAFTAWDGEGAWTAEQTYDSPDFAASIQEVVDRAGWKAGNAMVIYIDNDASDVAYRIWHSWNGWDNDHDNDRPLLTITYYTPGMGVTN